MKRSARLFAAMLVVSAQAITVATEPVPETSATVATVPGFSWDRVPLNLHFGKRTTDLTDSEIDYLAI
uniref:hypothetical protein n=1 Tax=Stieleria sp. TaxID=2795976 RepID=UPI003567E9D4